MHFDATVSLGSILQVSAIVLGIWKGRGWVDEFKDAMFRRHRQNTLRLDFMLRLINQSRREQGLAEIECPYRVIVDQ